MWCHWDPVRAVGRVFLKVKSSWWPGNQRKKCFILKSCTAAPACLPWLRARASELSHPGHGDTELGRLQKRFKPLRQGLQGGGGWWTQHQCSVPGRQVPGALPKHWKIAGGEGGVAQSLCPAGAACAGGSRVPEIHPALAELVPWSQLSKSTLGFLGANREQERGGSSWQPHSATAYTGVTLRAHMNSVSIPRKRGLNPIHCTGAGFV